MSWILQSDRKANETSKSLRITSRRLLSSLNSLPFLAFPPSPLPVHLSRSSNRIHRCPHPLVSNPSSTSFPFSPLFPQLSSFLTLPSLSIQLYATDLIHFQPIRVSALPRIPLSSSLNLNLPIINFSLNKNFPHFSKSRLTRGAKRVDLRRIIIDRRRGLSGKVGMESLRSRKREFQGLPQCESLHSLTYPLMSFKLIGSLASVIGRCPLSMMIIS